MFLFVAEKMKEKQKKFDKYSMKQLIGFQLITEKERKKEKSLNFYVALLCYFLKHAAVSQKKINKEEEKIDLNWCFQHHH